MIQRIVTFLFLLFTLNAAVAQQHICGVTHEDQLGMIEFIENFNKNPQMHTRSTDPIYVPIKFHMTARNDGSGRVRADKMLSQMSVLIEALLISDLSNIFKILFLFTELIKAPSFL